MRNQSLTCNGNITSELTCIVQSWGSDGMPGLRRNQKNERRTSQSAADVGREATPELGR